MTTDIWACNRLRWATFPPFDWVSSVKLRVPQRVRCMNLLQHGSAATISRAEMFCSQSLAFGWEFSTWWERTVELPMFFCYYIAFC